MKVFQSEDPVPRNSKAFDAKWFEARGDRAADAPEAGDDRRSALEVAAVLGEGRARPHGALPEEPARPREKEAENRLGDDRPVKRAEMDFHAGRSVTPRHKLASGRRCREDPELRRARVPLFPEMPNNGVCRRREGLQKRALAFGAHDAAPLGHERPEELQVPVIRPKAPLGPLKPNQVRVHSSSLPL